jgi:hypothetical protein
LSLVLQRFKHNLSAKKVFGWRMSDGLTGTSSL